MFQLFGSRAAQSVYRCSALLGAMFLCCGPVDTAISLRVSNVPAAATELRVQIAIDGQASGNVGSFTPPAAGQADERIGLRLVGKTSGSAKISVAACNSSCLVGSASVDASLGQGDLELATALQPTPEKLDLSQCDPKGSIICNIGLDRNPQTGQTQLAITGAGFQEGGRVFIDNVELPSARRISGSRIELDSIDLTSSLTITVDLRNPDGSSILRRLPLTGIPIEPAAMPIDPVQPAPAADSMPLVSGLLAQDLDGDGHIDIAVVGTTYSNIYRFVSSTPGFLNIYWGDGRGGFSKSVISSKLPGLPRSIAAGRLKGPNQPPVIVIPTADPFLGFIDSNTPLTGQLVIFASSSPRAYTMTTVSAVGKMISATPHQAVMTDIDRDGQLDLVVASSSNVNTPLTTSGGVYYWKGSGATWNFATLPTATPIPIAAGTYPIYIEPWDGPDGQSKGDLAIATSKGPNISSTPGELQLLHNNGTGTFTPTRLPLTGLPAQLVSGDLNGDGLGDLGVICPLSGDGLSNLRRVLLFASPAAGVAPLPVDLASPVGSGAAIDLFGDGRLDLGVLSSDNFNSAGKLSLLLTRAVSPALVVPQVNFVLRAPGRGLTVAADINEDGKRDLVVSTSGLLDPVGPTTGLLDLYLRR